MDAEAMTQVARDGLAYLAASLSMDSALASSAQDARDDWSRLEVAYGVLQAHAFNVSDDSFELFRIVVRDSPDELLCSLGEGLVQTWINSNIDDLANWMRVRARADSRWRQVLSCVTLYEDALSHESSEALRGYLFGF